MQIGLAAQHTMCGAFVVRSSWELSQKRRDTSPFAADWNAATSVSLSPPKAQALKSRTSVKQEELFVYVFEQGSGAFELHGGVLHG